MLIAIRNTKKDWVQADWYRIQFNLNDKTKTLKRSDIRSAKLEENTLEIHRKSGAAFTIDLSAYAAESKTSFLKIFEQ